MQNEESSHEDYAVGSRAIDQSVVTFLSESIDDTNSIYCRGGPFSKNPLEIEVQDGNHRGGLSVDCYASRKIRWCFYGVMVTFFGIAAIFLTAKVWQGKIPYDLSSADGTAPYGSTPSPNQSLPTTSEQQQQRIKGGSERPLTSSCEIVLLIVRHCEKYGPTVKDTFHNQHCSYVGRQRAEYFANLFGSDDDDSSHRELHRWPFPVNLYALALDRETHYNYREWEMLYPLSRKTGLNITLQPDNDSMAALFLKQVHENSGLCGTVSVVSWKHSEMVGLIEALGCNDKNAGCPTQKFDKHEFDLVWILQFVYQPNQTVWWNQEESVFEPAGLWGSTRTTPNKANDDDANINNNDDGLTRNDKLPLDWLLFATVSNQNFDPLRLSEGKIAFP